jgi:hypothetical protein
MARQFRANCTILTFLSKNPINNTHSKQSGGTAGKTFNPQEGIKESAERAEACIYPGFSTHKDN